MTKNGLLWIGIPIILIVILVLTFSSSTAKIWVPTYNIKDKRALGMYVFYSELKKSIPSNKFIEEQNSIQAILDENQWGEDWTNHIFIYT